MHKIGVFQSRLTATKSGQIQFFPVENWQNEFTIAAEVGFDFIEWVVESNSYNFNPILTPEGRREISQVIGSTGVMVQGICADVFMDTPIVSSEGLRMLDALIDAAATANTKFLELPLLGASEPSQHFTKAELGAALKQREQQLIDHGLHLFVEINLPPSAMAEFLAKLQTSTVLINYDTGNSAYWGYSSTKEYQAYGKMFGSIHIKDCTPEDYSVPLGTGNFEFDAFFAGLAEINYQGDFTLQTERNTEDFISAAKAYKFFVEQLIRKYL